MSDTLYDNPVIHCPCGIILRRHQSWWLVEYPTTYSRPLKVYRLTGSWAPWVTKHLKADAAPPLSVPIALPSPFWTTEFVLSPGFGGYDICGYVRTEEADENPVHLAQAMVDREFDPIPSSFTSVFKALPTELVPILAIILSRDVSATFEIITARYMPTYHPESPWRTLSGTDAVHDVLGWRDMREWIKPR